MRKEQFYPYIAILLVLGYAYFLYNRLVTEKAKTSISGTNTKSEVLESKFKDLVSEDKELRNKVIVPKDEDADKFWDRVLK